MVKEKGLVALLPDLFLFFGYTDWKLTFFLQNIVQQLIDENIFSPRTTQMAFKIGLTNPFL
ncbi:MAG: hypothetical protein RBR87_16245 [Bacteroidales bacterium]|jgi:hypothetical protein|nr:hypothetical protein [Bacteroidales bacterium]